jgi:hypothetical protein
MVSVKIEEEKRSPGGIQGLGFHPTTTALAKRGARLGCLPSPVIFAAAIDQFPLIISALLPPLLQ